MLLLWYLVLCTTVVPGAAAVVPGTLVCIEAGGFPVFRLPEPAEAPGVFNYRDAKKNNSKLDDDYPVQHWLHA